MSNLNGVLDWKLDSLTTLTYDIWLHLIIAPPLISILYKSLQHTPSLFSPLCSHPSFPGDGFKQWIFFNCTHQVFSSQSQGQIYFTTGSLSQIISSWCQVSWDPTTSIFSFQLSTCRYIPYVTSSLTRGRVCCLRLLLVLASVSHSRVRAP
jgi:hypothetical protein